MSDPANDPMPNACEEEAAAWCWRIAEGALAPHEQEAFDAWVKADPRHRETFEHMVIVWQGTDAIAEMPGFLSLRAKALMTMERAREETAAPPPRVRLWYGGLAAAAAILVLLVSGYWWLSPGVDIYETGIGERRVVRLDDGSRLSLDASSRVLVAYSGDRRAITLERGRAKFDVARDPMRPFAVTAGDNTVVATGTAFSVELLANKVRVLLYEGHVSVLQRPALGGAPVPVRITDRNAPADQALAPGRELVTNMASGAAVVAPVDIERSLSWEAGRLSFTDEPLSSAVERVNRYADTPVVVGDEDVGRHMINGVFDAGDTRGFVSGIVSLYGVYARREGNRIVLLSRPPAAR